MIRQTLVAAAMTGLLLAPACAESPSTTERAEIENIVKEYLIANPEVVEEALIALQAKRDSDASRDAQAAITANAEGLYANASSPFVGAEDAEITVVEFFDYRCGYCKRSTDWVRNMPAKFDGKVRVVYKELPIFGGVSETAALAALAAHKQDKYVEMHTGLMGIKNNNDLTEKAIDKVAAEAGLNVKLMRADMDSMEIQKQLADMKSLGRSLNVDGTPAFFVDNTRIVGADQKGLYAAIEAQLAN